MCGLFFTRQDMTLPEVHIDERATFIKADARELAIALLTQHAPNVVCFSRTAVM